MLLDGRAQEKGISRRRSDATILLVCNAHHDVVNFTLPAVAEGRNWQGLIDTNSAEIQLPAFEFGHTYAVTGRFMLAFALVTENIRARRLRQGLDASLDITEAPLQS
jgi:glycogen operon protein